MDPVTTVSVLALIVSLGSFGVTWWATKISRRSLEYAIAMQKQTEITEYERARTNLLQHITDSIATLERTRIEIGTLKADFEAELEPVQLIMANYTSIFTIYLPKIEQAIAENNEHWRQVSQWGEGKGLSDLLNANAVLYKCTKDHEIARETGFYLVTEFKAKLQMAKEHIPKAAK